MKKIIPVIVLCLFTFTGYLSAQSIALGFDGTITEGAENTEAITVTLSGTTETFADPIAAGNIAVTNLPGGVTYSITRDSDTQLTITLTANRAQDYDLDITNMTVSIPDSEIDLYTGSNLEASSGVTFTATDDAESIAMTDDGTIDEGSEDTEEITVTLTGGTFANPIDDTNWSLTNLPQGVTKGTVIRDNATQVTITLSGNRSDDYDTDITNLTLTVTADEVDDYDAAFVVNSGVTFTATDDAESIAMTDDGTIDEGSEDTEEITVTLTGGTFANPIDDTNWSLTNLPQGVTKGTVIRDNATQVTIMLSGNRSDDYDTDITNLTLTVTADEVDDYDAAFVVNSGVTFTATDDAESISMTDDGLIEEGYEDSEIITVTLTGGTFVGSLTPASWTLTNLPTGVSRGTVTKTGPTSATIALSNNRTVDYSSNITNLTLTIASSEINDTSGGTGLTVNTGVTFTALDEPTATLTTETVDICELETYDLTVTVSGGNDPWDIKYKKPDNSIVELFNKPASFTINVSDQGTYVLTEVKDDDGVLGSYSGSATVNVNPLPTPSITGPTTACNGAIMVYNAVGNSGSTYLWGGLDDCTAIGGLTNDSLEVQWTWDNAKNLGGFNVTETTEKGCETTTSDLSVTLQDRPSKPTVDCSFPGTGEDEYCEGTTFTLRSSSPAGTEGWLWSNDIATRNMTVAETGSYTVRVVNSNGCYSQSSDAYSVTKNPKPLASIAVQGDNSICVEETGAFRVSLYQGTGDYTVGYTDGTTPGTETTGAAYFDITDNKSSATTMTYTITSVVDSKTCAGQILTPSASITVNDLPPVTFTPPNTTFLSTDSEVILTGGTPLGGTYSGDPVTAGKFYPTLASTVSPNDVTYTYIDPATGCANSVTVQFEVIVATGDILSAHAYDNGSGKFIYCFTTDIDTLTGSSVNGEPGGFFSGPGITNFDTDLAFFNPATAGAGEHEIVYRYIVILDPVLMIWQYAYVYKTVVVDDPGVKFMSGLDLKYCANDDSVEIVLLGNINNEDIIGFEGVEGVTGLGVSNPYPDVYWFNPKKGATGPRTIAYNYTRDFSQCIIHDEKLITVNPLPLLNFEILDSCIFTTTGTDSILFNNTSPDIPNVVTWEWNFGDGQTSPEESPWHDYNSVGTKLIVLKATNNFGCTDQVQQIQEFQEISRALFDWENECLGDTMHFMFKFGEVQGTVISWKWDFNDGAVSVDSTISNPYHKYDVSDNYDVELKVVNDFGCKDTLVQMVPVRPTFLVNGDNPYFEDFETGSGGWLTDADEGSDNSWEFGKPSGTIIKETLTGDAWVTSLGGLYVANEKSYVESPCFDFSEIEKPMVRLDVWAHTENTRDGAAIQTSIDDGKTWLVLGSNLDGINWYNSALLTGEPGGQRLGWTGTSQSEWKEARNLIDHLKGTKYRMRIAFGADAVASNYEGFAFDNVWVGERTRMVLLEHFTNSTSAGSLDADPDVNAITNQNTREVIDIQYHTSFPGVDPRNAYFPSGPSSRTLYYGVASVPYSVMDGVEYFQGFGGEGGAYSWEEKNLLRSILIDPLTTIDLSSSYLTDNNIYVEAKIGLLDTTLKEENLTLQIAIVENESSFFESVLKKMLPDAGGTSLIDQWNAGNSVTIYQSWSFNPTDFVSVDSLVLIAFVQNEDAKDVYQAAYIGFKDLLGTGMFNRPGTTSELDYLVYPNPASGKVYLKFEQAMKGDMQVHVFNELGALVEVNVLQKGIDLFSFDVTNYRQGVYFIHVTGSENNTKGWKKFIVIH